MSRHVIVALAVLAAVLQVTADTRPVVTVDVPAVGVQIKDAVAQVMGAIDDAQAVVGALVSALLRTGRSAALTAGGGGGAVPNCLVLREREAGAAAVRAARRLRDCAVSAAATAAGAARALLLDPEALANATRQAGLSAPSAVACMALALGAAWGDARNVAARAADCLDPED